MSRNEIHDRVTQIFQEVFDDEELMIQDSTCAEDIEEWDSLEQINLLIAMEKEFEIKFHIAEVSQLKNVGEMMDLIERKLSV